MILLLSTLALPSSSVLAQDEPKQTPPPQPGNSQPAPVGQSPQEQAPPQQPPQDQAPKEEKKDEGTNPAHLAAEKTVQAAVATKHLGVAALVKGASWGKGRGNGAH